MNNKRIILAFISGLFFFSIFACARENKEMFGFIHHPVVAGKFYPQAKEKLQMVVEKFIKNVSPEKIEGEIMGLISPHAGYVYSGQVAAHGYKLLEGQNFDTVIIIGPSHYVNFEGAALLDKKYLETPLGVVKIDISLARSIAAQNEKIRYFNEAYEKEHSIEVQIPFLQTVLDDFKIVPIITGTYNPDDCRMLAKAIVDSIPEEKKVLLIASTDMSHYYVYGKACLMDGLTLRLLEEYNIDGLINNVGKGDCELCGMSGVITLMESCKTLGANKIKLLKYANSGDVTGNKRKVVGYGSLIVTGPYSFNNKKTESIKKKELKSSQREKKMLLNEIEKEKLLKIARRTLETYLATKNKPDFRIEDEILKEKRGTFVTLHKNDKLRGCIGNMVGQKALWETVRDMVIESALNDSRFSPVTKEELNQIDIEISVLTPLERVDDVEKIIMGKHGVIIKKGFRQGVFLPQVADETGWSREEFLSALCSHKAGLPADAWKDKDVEIYIFSAQVFGEKNKN